MSSTYNGNPANNPTEITIPSDGDGPIKADDVNPAFMGIMDLIRHNHTTGTFVAQIFTADGTFTAPANCQGVFLIGCGGGGGGGTGAGNGVSTNEYWCGGGGGGAALASVMFVPVTPGANYAVAIGAVGTGAVGGTSFSPGTSGGDTTFGSLATFKGGFFGTSATNSGSSKSTASTGYMLALGGKPSGLSSYHNLIPASFGFVAWDTASVAGITALPAVNQIIGEGGPGGTSNYLSGLGAGPGAPCNFGGYAGGTRGAKGNDSGSYRGGGGGGGGAAGPFGAGGAGGAGSNANTSGATTAGTAGSSAAANTGAGGGGGGAGGAANAGVGGTSNYNSSGGNGGSGKLIVIYASNGV